MFLLIEKNCSKNYSVNDSKDSEKIEIFSFSSSVLFGNEEKFSCCSVYAFYGTALFSLNHFSVWWQAIR
jgi:hypothetical protein